MATSLSLITRAMRLAGVIGKGETPDADESADGLVSLNSMLESWQTESLYVYQIEENSFTWTGGQQSRTVGAAGDFVLSRPAQIDESSYFVQNNVSYPIKLINSSAWAGIPAKTTTSTIPFWIYPEYGVAIVTLYAYPTPSANITFKLRSQELLQSFADLTTTLSLPMGYERAIVYSLAEEFGPEFGVQIQPVVADKARKARANIKRINSVPPVMASEVGYMSRRMAGNVYADMPD